ncbi:MAG: hypothetical protein ACRC78_05405 [Planktothrix sp.]
MTAFIKENLPTSVDTLEKLAVWVGAASNQINRLTSASEGSGSPQRVAQFGIFNVEANNTSRVIIRLSLELEDTFAIDNRPIWENAKEISTDFIPAPFLAA